MKLTVASVAALGVLALLTAAWPNGGAGQTTASGAPAAGAPASGPDVQVDPASLPHQRAGLWKIVFDDGQNPFTATLCLSGKAPLIPKMPPGCSQLSLKRTVQGAYVMDLNCATPDSTAVIHAVVTGDLQTHMAEDGVTTLSTKTAPTKTTKTHAEETWIAPCPAGRPPADQ